MKSGDKVVCINTDNYTPISALPIVLGGTYTIYSTLSKGKILTEIVLVGVGIPFAANRFMSLTKYRSLKIKKIQKRITSS